MAENLSNSNKYYRIKRRIEDHQKIRQMLTSGYTHATLYYNVRHILAFEFKENKKDRSREKKVWIILLPQLHLLLLDEVIA